MKAPFGWTEVLTTAEMRAVESAAMASGAVTGLELMERAGAAVAGHIRLRWPKARRATVLCGPGNNGGDGYVVAQHLHQAGWRVRLLGMDNTPGPDAAEMKRRWAEMGEIAPLTEAELRRRGESSDVYVDAIFGLGLTRPMEGEIGIILRYLGGSRGDCAFFGERLVAVDCPSGLCMDSGAVLGWPRGDSENAPRARMTVAFDSPKPGHLLDQGPALCGELVIADIGLQRWRETEAGGFRWRSPRLTTPDLDFWVKGGCRDDNHLTLLHLAKTQAIKTHKFDHGYALVIAGSTGQGGAARLSARAALRTGAGLVTICPPKSALIDHAGPPDALMRRSVDDAVALADRLTDTRITALCLGPGCGTTRATDLLPPALASGRGTVLDADALTALADRDFDVLHERCVLTPHMGEFARLFPELAKRLLETPETGPAYSKLDAAREAAARCGAVVLLKGPDTVIAAPDGQARIHSAHDVPWLATAGSGDVLAGIITGLLARGLPPLDAAATGAFLHAQAARRFGPGLIADDLPDQLPGVFRDLGL